MKKIDIKQNMQIGLTSSATQIDGGELDHTWNYWHRCNRIKDGSSPAKSALHWEHFQEDTLMLSAMGIETYRFSIEWARIEPDEGSFDESAIDQLREELMLLHSLNIRPMICLHHFTNPLWFDNCGGWTVAKNIVYYLRYVEKIISSVGHLCEDYITINEPNTYAFNSYYHGIWPPAKKSVSAAMNVMSVMAAAHIRAYRLIHRLREEKNLPKTMVGISLQMRVFEGRVRTNPAHNAAAMLAEKTYQTAIAEAVTIGKFTGHLKNLSRAKIGQYCDFHGLNFTTRTLITPTRNSTKLHSTKNDSGTEICPRGMVVCAKKLMKICNLPIFITENCVSDTNDAFRCRFLYETMLELARSDLPFERYYHRSLDGFEWLEGHSTKYGLIDVDFISGERKMKKSGEFYCELIKMKAITSQMHEEYIAMQSYHH